MKIHTCLLLLFVFAAPPVALADIVQYTDADGRTHFVDSEKKVPDAYRDQLRAQPALPTISRVKPGREKLYEKERYAPPPSRASVELFVAEWCGYCRKLEDYLNKKGVRYTAYDIDKDPRRRKEYKTLGSGLPITRIGETIIQGYNPEAIDSALAQLN